MNTISGLRNDNIIISDIIIQLKFEIILNFFPCPYIPTFKWHTLSYLPIIIIHWNNFGFEFQ